MPKIEMGKQYKTLSGLPARILCTDRNHPSYPVIALVPGIAHERPITYTKDGAFSSSGVENTLDLIEVKPRVKREYWLNVYRTFSSCPYSSKDTADDCALDHRLACVPITLDCEHGEGLE